MLNIEENVDIACTVVYWDFAALTYVNKSLPTKELKFDTEHKLGTFLASSYQITIYSTKLTRMLDI